LKTARKEKFDDIIPARTNLLLQTAMYNYFKFLLMQNSWIALLFRKNVLLAILLSVTTENSFNEKQN
jgi:hypothetical protein